MSELPEISQHVSPSMARPRVRRPHDHRGMIVLWAIVGAALGALLQLVMRSGVVPPMWTGLVLLVGAPFAIAVYLARTCQHARPSFAIAAVFAVATAAGTIAAFVHDQPLRLATVSAMDGLGMIGGVTAFATVTGVVALLMRAWWVHARFQLRCQDGTLCPACAYIISAAPSERCPECGVPVGTPTRRHGPLMASASWLGRGRGRRIAVMALLAVTLACPLVVGRDVLAFRWRVADGRRGALRTYRGSPRARGVEVPLPARDNEEVSLFATYVAAVPGFTEPSMDVLARTAYGVDAIARLDAARTRVALEFGVPGDLLDRLVRVAWFRIEVGEIDRATESSGAFKAMPPKIRLEVDPAPYFP